ncbi:hypothetical protein [Puniceicoccus vermicola]|uniref:PEP-CTERM sorting domain-containing protein n=1 Tax=Puniceicoccus vermicola TaxID=388746 RepID=A0A7X1AYD5_9BACT|nr:hypothetical protein [Puniceicoccus vermicola]MBC2602162.1 hypothetical protein [Puniceicoccus vermicola]
MKKSSIFSVGLLAVMTSGAGLQAIVLSNFDFENATSGASLGGAVGTARSTGGVGDGFDFTSSVSGGTYTVSTLSHSGPGDMNAVGANVRSDTLALSTSGGFSGNFLEISPHRLTNTGAGDKNPGSFGGDYFRFSVQADAGSSLSLNSFSYDKGTGDGATDGGTISFQSQAWYSLDGGSTWVKMQEDQNLSHTAEGKFSSSSSFIDLTEVAALQEVTGEIQIALSLGDNSGRSAYSSSSTNPAAFYLDNIQLAGDISAIPEPGQAGLLFGVVGLFLLGTRRRLRKD